jgi:hypothetical protein
MANKFRNESQIKIGGVEILLRPTFENCANLEASLGYGLQALAMKLSEAAKDSKKMPVSTDLVKVVYFCQAEKKYTLEEVWDFAKIEGTINIIAPILIFISTITTGDKTQVEASFSDVKKNQ